MHKTLAILTLLALPLTALAAGELRFTVRETYGIQRNGIPVDELVTLPAAVPDGTPFRLTRDGEAVSAQFRNATPGQDSDKWWLDFTSHHSPFETVTYKIEYGPDTQPGPEREQGMAVTESDDAFLITHGPHLKWKLRRDLLGLLDSVGIPPKEYVRPGAAGLVLRDVAEKEHQLGGTGTQARVLRQGTTAIGLRFEKTETADELAGVRWSVDLVFPARVSWIDVDLRVDDPQHRVAALGWQVALNLDEPTGKVPTLVEFGASRTVYGTLTKSGQMELKALPSQDIPWQVWRGKAGKLRLMEAVPPQSTLLPEGWAHVMDRDRCLALAVEGFGRLGDEQITVDGDGTITAWREFPANGAREKRMQSWFHFVKFPHQLGAATSPQSMQNPPEVRWQQP